MGVRVDDAYAGWTSGFCGRSFIGANEIAMMS
jgi:hypothetical protein